MKNKDTRIKVRVTFEEDFSYLVDRLYTVWSIRELVKLLKKENKLDKVVSWDYE